MSAGITGYADITIRRKDGSVKDQYRMPNAVHDVLRTELRNEVKATGTMTMTPRQMLIALTDDGDTTATLRIKAHVSGPTTPPMLDGSISSDGNDYGLSYTVQGVQFTTLSGVASVKSVTLQTEGSVQLAQTASGFTGTGAGATFDSDDTLDVTYTLNFAFSNGNDTVTNISSLTEAYRTRMVEAVRNGGTNNYLAINRWELRKGKDGADPGPTVIVHQFGALATDVGTTGCSATITVAPVTSIEAPDTIYGYTTVNSVVAVVFLITLTGGSWATGSTLVFTPSFSIT